MARCSGGMVMLDARRRDRADDALRQARAKFDGARADRVEVAVRGRQCPKLTLEQRCRVADRGARVDGARLLAIESLLVHDDTERGGANHGEKHDHDRELDEGSAAARASHGHQTALARALDRTSWRAPSAYCTLSLSAADPVDGAAVHHSEIPPASALPDAAAHAVARIDSMRACPRSAAAPARAESPVRRATATDVDASASTPVPSTRHATRSSTRVKAGR